MRATTAVIMLALASASSGAAAGAYGVSNLSDCKQGYALVERSIEISRRAVKASDPTLASLIARDAKFELWHGDASNDFRERGVAAANAFFRELNSNTLVVRKGIAPICTVDSKTAVIEFISANGKESVLATFTFEGPQLVGVRADTFLREEGQLTEGNR